VTNRLTIVPIFQDEAFAFIAKHHRHHRKPVGSLFQVAAAASGGIVGVAVVGRPVARFLQDGFTVEVTRLCTTGEANACSMLYGACGRYRDTHGLNKITLINYTTT
jgi:hypothetical protein